jgi:N-acetylglutamate synthase-like GNAT family acetyltransferase
MKSTTNHLIEPCTIFDFKRVCELIQEFELDNRNLTPEQFLVIKQDFEIIAFGRVLEHENCSEICSLGVIKNKRNQGLAKKLMMALIQKATKPIYIVSILPKYFIAMGFELCDKFPEVIQGKLNYCTGSLPVDEKYLAMKWPIT